MNKLRLLISIILFAIMTVIFYYIGDLLIWWRFRWYVPRYDWILAFSHYATHTVTTLLALLLSGVYYISTDTKRSKNK